MGKEKGHPMGGLSLSRSEEHNCAFCENAVHNPDHRIAIGIFDPNQYAQVRQAPQSSWNYKQQSRRRYATKSNDWINLIAR